MAASPIRFEPIAIVGRACVLPDALDPATLWRNVEARRLSLTPVPEGRWGVPRGAVAGFAADERDRAACDIGGYVRGFDAVFDPRGFALDAAALDGLDPLFHWVLHGVREALREAGHAEPSPHTGLVLGNLSLPSTGMARFAEQAWVQRALAAQGTSGYTPPAGLLSDPRNRFMSGLPAHLCAQALGLGAGAFALDAACASSLYAIKLACDRLHDRSADVMVAGAVNRADDLFLHIGFTALQALSPSGRSRPFHRDADGLLCAEGAAFVVLRRLQDALSAGDRIFGVIRGVGLSNDGRGQGLLVPSQDGQQRAMREAYAMAGVSPRSVSLVECHATGTQLGDATELRSLANVFDGAADVPVGSLKSNLGHLITAAGAAGLLKVLGAMQAGVRPATLNADAPADVLRGTPLRLLHEAQPWTGLRRAAVSAFGFGGNNAHLIVDAWDGPTPEIAVPVRARPSDEPVAIVAVGARVGRGQHRHDLARALHEGRPDSAARAEVAVELDGLRFPPRDLERTLPQQLLMLEAAREAAAAVVLPRERTWVLVGMGCDTEVARYHARWRIPAWLADAQARQRAPDAFQSPLDAAAVVGTMPNIVANRLSVQLDLAGPSLTLSAEEASGLVALTQARRALQRGEADAVLVGAVDLSHEPAHRTALRALGRPDAPGDAAVALVLKRLSDAQRDGDVVFAVLEEEAAPGALRFGDGDVDVDIAARFGRAHHAHGLVALASAALAIHHGLRLRANAPADIWDGRRAAEIVVDVLGAPPLRIGLRDSGAAPVPLVGAPPSLPTSKRLHLSAHRADVVLPPGEPEVQTMQAAPRLPPTEETELLDLRAEPLRPEAEPLLPASAPLRVDANAALPRAEAAPWHWTLLAQVATAHRSFIEQQVETHRKFLALQLQVGERLMHGHMRPGLPHAVPPATPARPIVPRAAAANAPLTAPKSAPVTPIRPTALPGPKFDRAQLEHLASGTISTLFGAQFETQDGYTRQTRMPMPPLLLADRVTGIAAEPGSMQLGTLWTETDVRSDAWYLDDSGRMPAGVTIESGQADLLLISWLGVDLLNRGERVYRLLGCDVTFHGPLPRPGETLKFEIGIDGHARQGEVRLFFFHYDCHVDGQLRLSMRNGQAGFFTDAELADTGGVLWDAAQEHIDDPAPDPCANDGTQRAFGPDALRAFADGRPADCFGPAWEWTRSHLRTPRIGAGRMQLIDEVTQFDPRGGPWGRGHLRARRTVRPDDWFFAGHFKNDPCMPGTLMFEGGLQAMAFYLAAAGFTLKRDGWRFEPVPGAAIRMRCRGQVTPASRELVYELFVRTLSAGPQPTLVADLLCSVDGVKAFHAVSVGLRLVPDYPLTHWQTLGAHTEHRGGMPASPRALAGLQGVREPKPVAADADGFAYDYASLLACALGPPRQMFGRIYERFDAAPRRVARLPAPPYHFMSRVLKVGGPIGGLRAGSHVVAECDIPREVWYFEPDGSAGMPLCVLMEAALQPCGWLATYVGVTQADEELLPRNLDGTLHWRAPVLPTSGTLRTRATLSNVSRTAETIIVSFAMECFIGSERVVEASTVFGFFPPASFETQVGLPPTPEEAARLDEPSDFALDLRDAHRAGPLRLPGAMLRMLDRVTGWWPQGGKAGLGRLRAEKTVDPGEWFFKAHFFQDPVQPGSLGIEAMAQLLQFWMIERGYAERVPRARFEASMPERPMTWKYRGQVTPAQRHIVVELEVVEAGDAHALAEAWLWVDGKRIYHARQLGMRVVSGVEVQSSFLDETLDPAVDAWVGDHRPTWTVPALPMMSMADRLAGAVARHSGRSVVQLRDVQVRRWLPLAEPTRLRTEVDRMQADGEYRATLSVWREAPRAEMSRYEPVASGIVVVGEYLPPAPCAVQPLADAVEQVSPYDSGALPHGPAFQYLRRWRLGPSGADALLDAGVPGVPRGALHQGLLDGITHAIPHDALSQWAPQIAPDRVAYPHRIVSARFHAPLPAHGEVEVRARFAGFDGADAGFPMFDITLCAGPLVLLEMRLVEALVPKGRIGSASPASRRAFLRDRVFADGVGLSSSTDDGATRATQQDVQDSDWLAGTVAQCYRLPDGVRGGDRLAQIAARDHLARQLRCHPSEIELDEGSAHPAARPYFVQPLRIDHAADAVSVRSDVAPTRDFGAARAWWRRRLAIGPWPGEDLFFALAERFVDDVVIDDPAALAAARGTGCLFLANHQVAVESMLFNLLVAPLFDRPTLTLAKAEHRASWIGKLSELCFAYPGIAPMETMLLIERDDPQKVAQGFAQLAAQMRSGAANVLVHVEGTRALAARQPVARLSAALLDMAVAAGVAIVPVRFCGGLPIEPLAARIEFPLGFGRQTYRLGRPLRPEELAALPNKQRVDRVLAALNGVGPSPGEEKPTPPDTDFAVDVAARRERMGLAEESAVLFEAVSRCGERSPVMQALLETRAPADAGLAAWCDRLAEQLGWPKAVSR